MSHVKRCVHCDEEFTAKNASKKYCSAKCRSAVWARKNLPHRKEARTVTLKCRGCGDGFRTSNNRKVYCNKECRWKHLNSLRPTTKNELRQCPVCEKRFHPNQKRGTGRTYCSSKCKRFSDYIVRRKYYPGADLKTLRNGRCGGNWLTAIERDDYTCQLCHRKITESEWDAKRGNRLEVHHKDLTGNKKIKNHDLNNLVTYCTICHKLFHSISLVFLEGKYYIEGAIFKKLGLTEVKVAEEAKEET